VPQFLPQRYVGSQCEDAARRAFWDRTAAAPPPGWLDVRTPLLAAQQAGGRPWYLVHDSHWDQNAAALYGDHLAHTLDPRLRGSLRQEGTLTHNADLGLLLGQPKPDTYDKVLLDRPGVRTTVRSVPDPAIGDIPYLHATSTSTGPRLIPGKTVMLYDSFTDVSQQYVTPWFSDLTLIHNLSTEKSPPGVAALLANSDTIIIEVVERSVATGHSGTVAEEFVSQLETQLRAHPVRSSNPARPGG
jgi:alginate O-acetyltransferase complex protein AlgJ